MTMASIDKPVLILGGGINGAAIARELVLNRVPVCLVDTADIASGTTAYSSRLIHGGLRYLEYGEFDLVRESLGERTRLLRLAPQFVRPLRLFIPIEKRLGGLRSGMRKLFGFSSGKSGTTIQRGLWLVRAGLWFYDTYAKDPQLPKRGVHRVGQKDIPRVNAQAFRWMCSYYDGQMIYPERFVVALLQDARQLAQQHGTWFRIFTYHGANLRSRTIEIYRQAAAKAASGRGFGNNRIATCDDLVTAFEPAAIINATGAWVDRTLQRMNVSSRRLIGGTKGSHFLTSDERLRQALAGNGVYAEAADGRPMFVLPYGNATLVGTTDLPFDGSPETAVATREELDYLLAAVQRLFPDVSLTSEEIDLHYSGVRPLPYVGAATPASITRRHWLDENKTSAVPLFSAIGGKLTTCRSLAEETAAAVLGRLGLSAKSHSRDRILPGGEDYPRDAAALAAEQQRLKERCHLSDAQVKAVWELCGTQSHSRLATPQQLTADASLERDSVLGTSLPVQFVRRVIREEWVTRLGDLVERRLMLLYHRHLSERSLRQLAQLMVEEGILDPPSSDAEVAACRDRLERHFGKRLARSGDKVRDANLHGQ
jgi:glycerol-3-phosphate dehydrogenase